MKKVIYLAIIILSVPSFVSAHPGRTDAYGCHTCRTNCPSWGLEYDEYHCHQAKALPQPIEPIKSHKSNGGVGYTTPAPEYKQPTNPVKKLESPKMPIEKIDNIKEQKKAQSILETTKNAETDSFYQRILTFLFG